MLTKYVYKTNACDFYIILWLLYNSQGVLYSQGFISQVILLFISIISIKDFTVIFKSKSPMLKGLRIYLLYMFILGILLVLSNNTYRYESGDRLVNWYYLKYWCMNWLPICTFYKYCHNELITPKRIRLYSFLFLLMIILSFIHERMSIITQYLVDGDMSNNTGYQFLALFPLLIYWKNKPIFQYLLLIIIVASIILCFKRGAIAIGVVCTIWLLYNNFKKSTGKEKILLSSLSMIIIMVGIHYLVDFYNSNDFFQTRLQETIDGNSSGRDDIYQNITNYLTNLQDPALILFGGGAYYSIKLFGLEAHNDWLEMALCGGLFGTIIFIAYWKSFARQWLISKKFSNAHIIIGICLFITFSQTLFSMTNITVQMALPLIYAIYCLEKKTDIDLSK